MRITFGFKAESRAWEQVVPTGGQESGEIYPELDAQSMARILNSAWCGLLLQKSLNPEIDVRSYVSTLKSVYHRALSTVVTANRD